MNILVASKLSMITINDWVLLSLYFLEFMISVYACRSLITYLFTKIRDGVVSLFMLSVGAFFLTFSVQMAVSIMWRLEEVFNIDNQIYTTVKLIVWTMSHIGTTISLFFVGMLVVKRRFDIYITKHNPRGDDKK